MKLLVSLLLALFILGIYAQESSGLLHSNWMPTNSVFINPSSMLHSKTWLDINIIGVNAYANNDMVGLSNTNILQIANGKWNEELNFKQNKKKYHVYNRISIPSLGAVWNSRDHAAGISFGVRSFTDIRNIPDYVAQFIEHGVQTYSPQHLTDYSIKKLKLNSISFGEVRLSYANTFLKKRNHVFMGGVTLHKHFSIAGGAANIHQFDFNVLDDSLVRVVNLSTDAMYTPEAKLYAQGGLGLDIGFTYEKLYGNANTFYPNSPKMGCSRTPYKYKLGITVGDIGNVKFNRDEILYAGYNIENEFTIADYPNYDVNENNYVSALSQFTNDLDAGKVKKPEKVRLPTFISAQFDYNLWTSVIYVNTTIVQGIPSRKGKFGIRRANLLALTPRFETHLFELALPISLYEYTRPQIGLAARIYCLSFGTDKLLSLIGNGDVYGSDFYFNLKIPIKRNPKCKGRLIEPKFSPFRIKERSNPCDAYN